MRLFGSGDRIPEGDEIVPGNGGQKGSTIDGTRPTVEPRAPHRSSNKITARMHPAVYSHTGMVAGCFCEAGDGKLILVCPRRHTSAGVFRLRAILLTGAIVRQIVPIYFSRIIFLRFSMVSPIFMT